VLGGVSIVTALPLDSAVGPVQIEHPSGKLVVAIVSKTPASTGRR